MFLDGLQSIKRYLHIYRQALFLYNNAGNSFFKNEKMKVVVFSLLTLGKVKKNIYITGISNVPM